MGAEWTGSGTQRLHQWIWGAGRPDLAGNQLFQAGEWAEARKCYDAAFVRVFCTKEEWQDFTDEDKALVNEAKLLVHLNRAMCKLKQDQPVEALWDCDRAIELDPSSVKGYFRRAKVFLARAHQDLDKESQGRYWDVDKTKAHAEHARRSLEKAVALAGSEDDPQFKRTRAELRKVDRQLVQFARQYREEQKRLYHDKMMGSLQAKNHQLRERHASAAVQEEGCQYEGMPALGESDPEEEERQAGSLHAT